MTTTETTTYRWVEAHNRTNTPVFRGYWDIHRDHNPGFAMKVVDPIYKSLIQRISTHHYENMCEIGSDLGRSTAWFSKIASNIDVYDCNKDYIDFCRTQCYNHQKRFGPITNVNWQYTKYDMGKTIQTLPKKYDCIKLFRHDLAPYIPMMLTKLKQDGVLILYELDQNLRYKLYENLDQYGVVRVDAKTIYSVIIVKHK